MKTSKGNKIAELQKLVDAVVRKDREKIVKRPAKRKRTQQTDDHFNSSQTSAGEGEKMTEPEVTSSWAPLEHRQKVAIEDLVKGDYRSAATGRIFVVEERFPIHYRHGLMSLEEVLEVTADGLVLITGDSDLQRFNPRDTVFLDTETTGLSFTTGTYVFLVGCGFFSHDEYVVRQYFMQHYEEEETLILVLEHDLQSFKNLVTFNGAQFDVPMLKTRFMMQGRRFDLDSKPHCDLLKCARRLWKKKLRWCNLGHLETQLLGVERVDDVPGSLIPGLYSQYVRDRDGLHLERVFYHNKLDVLSMVTLMALVHQTLNYQSSGRYLSAEELYSLANIYKDRLLSETAISLYVQALNRADSCEMKLSILGSLGYLHKRIGDLDKAAECWLKMTDEIGMQHLAPHEELAKFWEHAKKDYTRAMQECYTVLELLERPPYRHDPESQQVLMSAWQHRLNRLIRKTESRKIK